MPRVRRSGDSGETGERMNKRRASEPGERPAKRARPWSAVSGEGRAVDSTGRERWIVGLKVAAGLLLALGLTFGLALLGHRYALGSPRFAIATLEVHGNRRLSTDDVMNLAGVHVGENLFRVSLEEAERRLLGNAWIEAVRVERRLPGFLKITLTEREPLAVVLLGERHFLVSRDGEPFKPVEGGDPSDFPLLSGLTAEQFADNRRGAVERIVEALGLLDDYRKLPLAVSLPPEEVALLPSGEAVLTVGREGVGFHLGRPPWKQKLLRAARVVGKTQSEGGRPRAVFLDNAEHPERVVVRVH